LDYVYNRENTEEPLRDFIRVQSLNNKEPVDPKERETFCTPLLVEFNFSSAASTFDIIEHNHDSTR
jgi:hypothetical protein